MAGEQKRFARFFFYLRNLREAALHTGARAEEAAVVTLVAAASVEEDKLIITISI